MTKWHEEHEVHASTLVMTANFLESNYISLRVVYYHNLGPRPAITRMFYLCYKVTAEYDIEQRAFVS